jgi:hypothetical protein
MAWEKLSIAYVAILAMLCEFLIGPDGFANRRTLVLIVEGAVFANVAYFLSHELTSYGAAIHQAARSCLVFTQ